LALAGQHTVRFHLIARQYLISPGFKLVHQKLTVFLMIGQSCGIVELVRLAIFIVIIHLIIEVEDKLCRLWVGT